jgi:hypothetical protein
MLSVYTSRYYDEEAAYELKKVCELGMGIYGYVYGCQRGIMRMCQGY